MGSLLFAFLPLLAAEPMATPVQRMILIQAVVYEGRPDAQDRKVITRPQIITVDRQQALVSVGQKDALNPTVLQEGTKPLELEEFQSDITFRITPALRADGRVLLRSSFATTELIENSDERTQTKESTTNLNTICKLGEKVTVPLFNATAPKAFSGRECWVELVLTEVDLKKGR